MERYRYRERVRDIEICASQMVVVHQADGSNTERLCVWGRSTPRLQAPLSLHITQTLTGQAHSVCVCVRESERESENMLQPKCRSAHTHTPMLKKYKSGNINLRLTKIHGMAISAT